MNYNIIYDKATNLDSLKASIEATGAIINVVFEHLSVINLTSSNTDFSNVSGVISFEIEQNMTMTPCTDWHRRRINTPTLPIRNFYLPRNTGSGSVIYLVDFGVDSAHPELSNSNIVNLWSYNQDFSDPLGHGTSMASVIVGSTLGVVPDAELKSVVLVTPDP